MKAHRSWLAAAAALVPTLLACSSAPARERAARARFDAGARHDSGTRDAPALAPPAHGLQIATRGHEIPAGADQEWCELAALPGDPDQTYAVGRTELAMTPFSHHLIVSIAPQGSHSLDDKPLAVPQPCQGAHDYGTDLTTLAASALPYSEQVLPQGIGYLLHGGQRLLFDYHSLDTSDLPIQAAHKLNLHFVDSIDRPARVFGFYNQYIDIPPHSARAFADQCTVKDDLVLWSLARHTHRYGTRFRVWWVGGEHDGELLWTSDDWEADITHPIDPPVILVAGTGFRWECAYDNPTDRELSFGTRATDEMCILFGAFAAVRNDAEVGPQSCYLFAPR